MPNMDTVISFYLYTRDPVHEIMHGWDPANPPRSGWEGVIGGGADWAEGPWAVDQPAPG